MKKIIVFWLICQSLFLGAQTVQLTPVANFEGKIGFQNPDGILVVDYKFSYCEKIRYGHYVVENAEEKQNLIDPTGKLLLNEWYEDISFESEYYCYLEQGELFQVYDLKNQRKVSDDWYDNADDSYKNRELLETERDNKLGIIFQGKLIYPAILDDSDDDRDLIRMGMVAGMQNDKWIPIRIDGSKKCQQSYDYVEALTYWDSKTQSMKGYNLLAVYDGMSGKYAIVNQYLEMTTEWFNQIDDFDENFLRVKNDDMENLVNSDGKLVSSKWWDDIDDFHEGFAIVGKDGHYNFMDLKGKLLLKDAVEDAERFSEGMAEIKTDKGTGFINTKGKIIIPPIYESATRFGDGIALCSTENHDCVGIDKSGKVLFTIKQYSPVYGFSHGIAAVANSEEMVQLINKKGELLSEPNYEVEEYGCFFMQKDGMYALVYNEKDLPVSYKHKNIAYDDDIITATSPGGKKNAFYEGRWICNEWYDNVEYYYFLEGKFSRKNIPIRVQNDGKFGLVDNAGKLITTEWYDDILIDDDVFEFQPDTFLIRVVNDHKYGLINSKGKLITDRWYTKIDADYLTEYQLGEYEAPFIKVWDELKVGLINLDGKLLGNQFFDNIDAGVFEENIYFPEMAILVSDNKKWNFLSLEGKILSDIWWDEISEGFLYSYWDGTAPTLESVKKDGKFFVLNDKYQQTNREGYDQVHEDLEYLSSNSNQTTFEVFRNDQIALIDKNGILISDWYSTDYSNLGSQIYVFGENGTYTIYNGWMKKVIAKEIEDVDEHLGNNLLKVQKNALLGYINLKGEVVIDFQYEFASTFSEGVAAVKKDKGYGYIDTLNNPITDFSWRDGFPVINGVGYYQDTDLKYIFVNKDGKPLSGKKYFDIARQEHGMYSLMQDGKIGAANAEGKEILPCKYSGLYILDENNILFYSGKKGGIAHSDGTIVIPAKYDEITLFGNFYRVKNKDLWGLVDSTGKEFIKCKYHEFSAIGNNLIIAINGDTRSLYDATGIELIPPKYVSIDRIPYSSFFLVQDIASGLFGVYSETGVQCVPPLYPDSFSVVSDSIIVFRQNGKEGAYSIAGNKICDAAYENIPFYSEKILVVVKDEKYGYIGMDGKEITPCEYEKAESFSEGLAAVAKTIDEKLRFGFIDRTGKVVINFDYEDALSFHSGYTAVGKDGRMAFIDKQGKKHTEYIFKSAKYDVGSVFRVERDYTFSLDVNTLK
ncbi:MAG: WG repeat-containing protein [Bacteroidetes bacterium]|nr:WG repeat-containing protein [Bacteroidota bacterium]